MVAEWKASTQFAAILTHTMPSRHGAEKQPTKHIGSSQEDKWTHDFSLSLFFKQTEHKKANDMSKGQCCCYTL
jgi:hypothetical protein